ncbi:MAG: LamG domain-containing protein, partial [Myxococcales bacterium]|nr:LamG domain-containing protein [Myxococcales bacterium]
DFDEDSGVDFGDVGMGGTGGGGTGSGMGGTGGGFPPEPDAGCADRPIGFWRFDDCRRTRTDLRDSSNQGHTAFRNVNLQCVPSQEGQAVSFEHRGDLVYAPDQPDYVLTEGVTVAAWVKPTTTDRVRTLLRKRDGATSAFALLLRRGEFIFVVRLASGRLAAVSAPAYANEWTHVAATYDNRYLRLYIGGQEASSQRAAGVLTASVGPLLMGNDGLGRRFDGLMDNVWFNTQAATPEGIMALTCLRQPFDLSVSPVDSPEVEAGTPVDYTLTVTNNNSPSCPPARAQSFINLPRGFTSSPFFADIPPLASGASADVHYEVTSGEETEPDSYPLELIVFPFDEGQDASVQATYNVAPPSGCHVRSSRALTIRHVSVVDDPIRTSMDGPSDDPRTGAWAFGRLMEHLSPTPQDAPDVTEAMFRSFGTSQTVNGFTIEARPAINGLVLDSWPRTPDGKLDLTRSPLRLLSIVNRVDLDDLSIGKGGEGRMVYGVLSPDGFPMEFTVILEYTLPADNQEQHAAWAERFHALQELPFPSEEYNAALQVLTDGFAERGVLPDGPNGSALIDIRTNEIALSFQWELREFRFDSDTGFLVPATIFQTPDASFNFTPTLGSFVNENEEIILTERHDAPDFFDGAPFKGGAVFNNIDFWDAPGISNPEARHKFSLNTCNGCHGAETDTPFLQTFPRFEGQQSDLAGFQTGITVFDPTTGEPRRMAELGRRRGLMEKIVCADDEP